MDQAAEKEQRIVHEAINFRYQRNKANEVYDDFLSKIKEMDNEKIENTLVVRALKIILSQSQNKFRQVLEPGTVLFRCRKIRESDLERSKGLSVKYDDKTKRYKTTGYNAYNSKEPPLTVPGEGRNNIKGVSYLYLAEDEYTACAEVKPESHSLLSVAQFQVKRQLQLVDLAHDDTTEILQELREERRDISFSSLFTQIMTQFAIPVMDSSEYYASQYIADYIRKFGVDGIAYRSSWTNKINYTIFNCAEINIGFKSSKIVWVPRLCYEILDINGQKAIKNNDDFHCSDRDIQDIAKRIGRSLK